MSREYPSVASSVGWRWSSSRVRPTKCVTPCDQAASRSCWSQLMWRTFNPQEENSSLQRSTISVGQSTPQITNGSPSTPLRPESGPNIGWVAMLWTPAGRQSCIIWAGYSLTEQVSMTTVPGFSFGATRRITSENALIVTQKKTTSCERSSSSETKRTPAGVDTACRPKPQTSCPAFASKPAQKNPKRPRPYTPIRMLSSLRPNRQSAQPEDAHHNYKSGREGDVDSVTLYYCRGILQYGLTEQPFGKD